MILRSLLAGAAACCAPLSSQQLPEGYAAQVQSLAPSAGNVHVLANGAIVSFDGTQLVVDQSGQPKRTLLTLPSLVFGSFTIDAGGNRVLFGENSTNNLWLVPLAGPAPSAPLANVVFNYDAAMLDAQRAVVSAKRSGFGGPDNDLVVVDLSTGAIQQFAALPGASGPVTVASNGDVYYATSSLAFPTPPGTVSVLRLRRNVVDQALQNNSVLTIANAEVVMAGLDAAGDIAFDDDQDLLFVDWFNNRVGEIDGATGGSPALGAPLLDYGIATGASTVQFQNTAGAGVFEPFQPAGARLFVHETDFFSSNSLRTVRPLRPALTSQPASPIPTGAFSLQVADGPANGFGIALLSPWTLPGSIALPLFGGEAPLHLNPSVLLGALPVIAVFDAQGGASFSLWNPGLQPSHTFTAQAVFLDQASSIGSSTAQTLRLGQ